MKTGWSKKVALIAFFGIMFNWIESLVSRGIIGASLVGEEILK